MIPRVFAMILLACSPALTASRAAPFDLVVKDRAIVQRCVTDEAARNIAVGMPGGFSFSFDPVRCRLAYVWYGNFLDFKPEGTGRGGRKAGILGTKRSIGTAELPIRIGSSLNEPQSILFKGYRKEAVTGIPTFLFQVDGVSIEQRVVSFDYDQVSIELHFPEKDGASRYYLMDSKAVASVELSDGLKMSNEGAIEIPAAASWAQIRLRLKPTNEAFARQEPTANGQLLYSMHCMACHSLDDSKRIGPGFAELWGGKRLVIRNGQHIEIEVDEAYIRESIIQPQAAIVQGYEQANQMIEFQHLLTEKQIDTLVQFLMDLKP